ncbi:MAG: hypothetical protein VZQ61_03495 [Christensenellaceae bacterium]
MIPDYEIQCLARALLPAIQKLFETEKGKREFEQWRAERRKSKLNNKKNDNLSPMNPTDYRSK